MFLRDLPAGRRVLVLVPHPDDEALACGGTISLLTEKKISVTACYVTSGERLLGEPSPSVKDKREEEARSVAQALGCTESLFLGFPDGKVGGHADEILQELARLVSDLRPDLILAPSPIDFHSDHRSLADISLKLRLGAGEAQLAFYEVYTTLRLNCLIDISAVLQRKKDAILGYLTSLYNKPEVYVHAALGLNAQRSIFTQSEGYFEAFYLVGRDETSEAVMDYLSYRT